MVEVIRGRRSFPKSDMSSSRCIATRLVPTVPWAIFNDSSGLDTDGNGPFDWLMDEAIERATHYAASQSVHPQQPCGVRLTYVDPLRSNNISIIC